MQRDTQQGLTRREALKRGAVIAGGLAWATPLVQAVGMSPAYAQITSPVPTPCCIDSGTKLAVLRMKYLGGTNFCPPTDSMPDALISCQDFSILHLPNPAYIVSSKQKAKIKNGAIELPTTVWFEGQVAVGGEFDIDSTLEIGETRFNGDAWIQIFDGSVPVLVQEIKIHTSCSQPLFTNDRFGGVLLVGCTREDELEPNPASRTEEPLENDTGPTTEPTEDLPAEAETGGDLPPEAETGGDLPPEAETGGEALKGSDPGSGAETTGEVLADD